MIYNAASLSLQINAAYNESITVATLAGNVLVNGQTVSAPSGSLAASQVDSIYIWGGGGNSMSVDLSAVNHSTFAALNGIYLFSEGAGLVVSGADEAEYVFGGTGSNIVSSNGGTDFLFGGQGTNVINGAGGIEYLFGGSGTNVLNGDGGLNYLFGSSGTDTLNGNGGTNYLFGGSGSDTLNANAGTNMLFGGSARAH